MDQKTALLDQLRLDRSEAPKAIGARRRLPWIIAGCATLAFAVTALLAINSDYKKNAARAAAAKSVVQIPTREVTTHGALLEAQGYVVALREATVSAKAIYKVNEVLVQEGQPVKQGQLIARLDDTNALAALNQATAQVKQIAAVLTVAKVAAADARPIYLRNKEQLSEGLISAEAFDASKSNFDAVEAAVLVAEENLNVAKATLAVSLRYEQDTLIKAPFDGVVTVKSAQPGEIVSPQFLGGGGIAKIVDMRSLEVDVDVSENYINRVHPEQPATITLSAYPEWQIPAKVVAVIPTAERAKATVKVRVGFKVQDPRIVPEMGARVSFLDNISTPKLGSMPVTGQLSADVAR